MAALTQQTARIVPPNTPMTSDRRNGTTPPWLMLATSDMMIPSSTPQPIVDAKPRHPLLMHSPTPMPRRFGAASAPQAMSRDHSNT